MIKAEIVEVGLYHLLDGFEVRGKGKLEGLGGIATPYFRSSLR